jgi:amino acid adenylation domain-containing protein
MFVLPWFERIASTSPESIAIQCEQRSVTFGELNEIAERIAHKLELAGVANSALVAVMVDRSPEMIAALLGIWKAGAAYVALDETLPQQRLAFMLFDAAATVVITQKKYLKRMSSTTGNLLALEDLCAPRDAAARTPAETVISQDSLAYLIYTSGSTGNPKGVAISHGGLGNTIEGVGRDLRLGKKDTVLAWSTIAFDVACLEIYLPLAFGSTLYLATRELAGGSRSRSELVERSGATVMFATPTLYRVLLEEGWPGNARMQLVVGGEVLPLPLALKLAGVCAALWNQYGPSEASICATRERVDSAAKKITIGRPLPNMTVHLLDRDFRPVPPGSIGEIFLGGAGVGLGYRNRPDLDRACFLIDPSRNGSENRMYRTGDLAIQLGDGRFDFIGRIDGQVKIRGFRVELGEVESALRACDGIEDVVVRAIELAPGDKRLVAFFVGNANPSVETWKQSLRRRLPQYMVPSEFVSLRTFPTTASGKVDIKALDALRLGGETFLPVANSLPLDAVQVRLQAIWQKLLKVGAIGIHQNFFELGGHSLLAARLLAEIERQFHVKMPQSVLVEQPTIHGLASRLRHNPEAEWPAVVTIQPGQTLPPLYIAHGTGGSLLSFMELAAELGSDLPVYGLQLPSSIKPGKVQISTLAAGYVRQIRALQSTGPYHLAGHSSGGLVVYEMACQLVRQGETVALLALLDCNPNTGKPGAPRERKHSLWRKGLRRAKFRLDERGAKEMIRRRILYGKLKVKAWLAEHSRDSTWSSDLIGADGYLALAVQQYQIPSYPGDVTLFVAEQEEGTRDEPARAWKGKIMGALEIFTVAGNHMSILSRPQVHGLAYEIARRMAQSVPASAEKVAV